MTDKSRTALMEAGALLNVLAITVKWGVAHELLVEVRRVAALVNEEALEPQVDAEVARLTRRSDHFEANWNAAEHVVTLRLAEIDRLKALLAEYGDHKQECNYYIGRFNSPCDCGFHDMTRKEGL